MMAASKSNTKMLDWLSQQWMSYAWAALVFALAFKLTWDLSALRESSTFLLFFGAVVTSAWLWGTGPGLAVTVASEFASAVLVVARRGGSSIDTADVIRLLVFGVVCGLVITLGMKRRDVEERLRASERHLRTLIETAPDSIIGADASGRIAVVNAETERMFGYTRDELLGQKIEVLIPERLRKTHAGHREAYGANPHIRPMGALSPTMQLLARRRDGSEFPVEISLSPMQTAGGMLVTSIIRDVTVHREAEAQHVELIREQTARAEAEAARHRFYELVQDLDAIVWERDVNTGHMTFISQRAVQLLGYPQEHWLQGTDAWLNHVHEVDRDAVREFLRNVNGGGPQTIEYRAITAEGRQLWLRLIVHVARDDHGAPQQLRGLTLDITERKQTEETLRVSEKLAATGRLAASIAHEINNPMASVTNLLYLIETEPRADEEIRRYARIAQEEMNRVAHITRQMLAFYRDSTSPATVNVRELLETTIELYERRLQQQRIHVEPQFEDVPQIRAFPGEMRQVFANLLLNALEATGEGGQIRLHVARAREWNDPARSGVRVTIADSGSGIRPEHQQHIFEPFFTTKGERGTGLGLWVSYGIVRKHGGTIRVHSSVREGRTGTSFSVFLPTEGVAVEPCALPITIPEKHAAAATPMIAKSAKNRAG